MEQLLSGWGGGMGVLLCWTERWRGGNRVSQRTELEEIRVSQRTESVDYCMRISVVFL